MAREHTGRLRPSRLTTNGWHGGTDVEHGNSRLWLFNERCVCVLVLVIVCVCVCVLVLVLVSVLVLVLV